MVSFLKGLSVLLFQGVLYFPVKAKERVTLESYIGDAMGKHLTREKPISNADTESYIFSLQRVNYSFKKLRGKNLIYHAFNESEKE